MMRILDRTDPDYARRLDALSRRGAAAPLEIEAAARDVIARVRAGGDAALRELTLRFESRRVEALELGPADRRSQAAGIAAPVRAALERAAARIRAFHEHERYPSFETESGGARVGSRVSPLDRIGIYVPGGTALYPSTVLMTAIPARVAGVREIIMTTPGPSPETLAAAEIAGVDPIFVIGGAQAVAAMAYGTESVPRVDKIVGPGNAYVAAAKRQVFGDVGIDSIAGPTEVVIAADDSADPRFVAADLLAQAEHDALAVPILVSVGARRGRAGGGRGGAPAGDPPAAGHRRALAARLRRRHRRRDRRGGGPGRQPAGPRARRAGAGRARALAASITTAGRDLHRRAHARAGGRLLRRPQPRPADRRQRPLRVPLGVADFVKRTSIIEYDAAALRAQGDDIERLAEVEGLHAHARAVAVRTRGPDPGTFTNRARSVRRHEPGGDAPWDDVSLSRREGRPGQGQRGEVGRSSGGRRGGVGVGARGGQARAGRADAARPARKPGRPAGARRGLAADPGRSAAAGLRVDAVLDRGQAARARAGRRRRRRRSCCACRAGCPAR